MLVLREPLEQPLARFALEPGALVREIRRDVAVADDEVALLERRDETRPRVEAVARIEQRRQRRVHVVEPAVLAVEICPDRPAERVVVIERKAEGRDAVAACRRRLGEPRSLLPLAG